MATLHMLEAVNLYIGRDPDPRKSTHLELDELALPQPEMLAGEHTPGGGVMAVNFTINAIAALKISCKLKGFNPDRFDAFASYRGEDNVLTAYGVVRDKRTGRATEARAVIEAVQAKLAPDAFSRPNHLGHDHGWEQVTSYTLWVGGVEKLAVDFWTNTFRVNGSDRFQDANSILRIPGA